MKLCLYKVKLSLYLVKLSPYLVKLSGVSDICIEDKHGNTPLHVAADRNQSGAGDLLLKHGASNKARNKDNLTPLLLAVIKGNCEVLKVSSVEDEISS